MIVDANLLLYAVDADSKQNPLAAAWLEETLNGANRVGLPWQTIGAFLRIVTHPRGGRQPIDRARSVDVRFGLVGGPGGVDPARH